jgi:hypothetical protein
MAVDSKKVEKTTSFEGQKSGLPIESYGLESGSEIKNFVLKEGALQRVNGGTTYAEVLPSESGGISSIHRFKNLWIAQRGNSIACEDSEASATFTTIFSGLSSSAKMFSAAWRDRIFFVNGTEAKVLLNKTESEIDTFRVAGDLGLEVPWYPSTNKSYYGYRISDSTLTFTNSGGGSIESGTFRYYFTVVDEQSNTESPPAGVVFTADGIYETTINPNPYFNLVTDWGPDYGLALSTGSQLITINQAGLVTLLTEISALNPRITHFRFYRAKLNATTNLYDTPFVVPFTTDANSTYVGFLSVKDFLASPSALVDDTATADLPAITFAENSSPPVTKARAENMRLKSLTLGVSINTSADIAERTSAFRHVRFFRDQMFGIGEKFPGITFTDNFNNPGQVYYRDVFEFSDILRGSEVYQPDYWPYIWEVGRGDGQNAIGLGVLGDTALLAFKERSTYYLSGSSPDNYILRIMDTNVGCVHQSTIQETPKGVIVLDRAGFFLFDKIGLGRKISKAIQDIIDRIDFTKSANFYSWYDPKDQRYYCAVAQAPYTYPNLTLCFDLEDEQWTFIQGLEGASRLADTSSQGEFVDLLGSATSGRLTTLESPQEVTLNGQIIESIWTSGPCTFGNEQYNKKLRWLYLRIKCAGSWTIRIEIIPDYNEMRKYTIDSYNQNQANATWYASETSSDGTLIWDEGAWAADGLKRSVVKIPVLGKGRSFQVRIINRDTSNDAYGFTIESISLEASGLNK